MTLRVRNRGTLDHAGGATIVRGNTVVNKTYGEVGTVRVTYQGIEYVFGPNETKSFWDNGIGTAVAAADSRLGIVDDMDGADIHLGATSVAVRKY